MYRPTTDSYFPVHMWHAVTRLHLDELAELPLEAFCDLLQEKGKGRFKQPEKIAKAIQRAITMSYRLGALAQESIQTIH
ncbi:hypothetical protein EfmAA242_02210 [Enterococcus faecium]|nr:hypothetical protein EfmAA242_02210 [Enterococcus faecium]